MNNTLTNAFLGIDVGSITTKIAIINEQDEIIVCSYAKTEGDPVRTIQAGLKEVSSVADATSKILSVGTTGSGRYLAGTLVGADTIKNEITAHAVAATVFLPEVQTVFEIGGQDSKIIIIRDGIATDFAMNTVCAAGTGSFLEHQALRLGIPIEDFGEYALRASSPVRIAGRCTVFAETDMVHKQQTGHNKENIIAGLCQALVRNYLNNVAKGKELLPPFVFQGGVAANLGIKSAFEQELEQKVIIPPNHIMMGAIGVAILAREELSGTTRFKGLEITMADYRTSGFECDECTNSCEIVQLLFEGEPVSRWGSRCNRWEM
ncbi:2-hydroxyglutaryl-CoA dehydratase [candidate division NPL-UPA2 bacterium Unc8]|uniref:2-hydroxyglutaryl-CoA dehydratase n=1 Tax=candidate division NPL-UPA2 bacterium Unc8 TaxID=1980939 RepID=A0A399FYV6_UNCN2|nr:(R)-phenyllactate dehydratase activator [Bacillota bacterium]MBT9146631.1 (R)-phenyllactate dehydratase activator [Bacillota bacterium]RII00599.1 MAG: 2-hydroxyglutaryl-CoA dehydratase [candidate division NPL-UPA2 bacterium Unc8]